MIKISVFVTRRYIFILANDNTNSVWFFYELFL